MEETEELIIINPSLSLSLLSFFLPPSCERASEREDDMRVNDPTIFHKMSMPSLVSHVSEAVILRSAFFGLEEA